MQLHEEILNILEPLFADVSSDELADAPAPLDLNVRAQVISKVDGMFRAAALQAVDGLVDQLKETLHMHNIGELLRDRRISLNKTQDELEREVEIARSILSRYENGKRVPKSQANIDKLCAALWPSAA